MELLDQLFVLIATGNKTNIELARQFAKSIIIPGKPTIDEYFQRFKTEAGRQFNHFSDYSEAKLLLKAEDWHQVDILNYAPDWFDKPFFIKYSGSDMELLPKQSITIPSQYGVNGDEWLTFHKYIDKNQNCSKTMQRQKLLQTRITVVLL